MGKPTPSDRDKRIYECLDCGHRIENPDDHPTQCPKCGGELQNISVPRDN